MIMLFHSRNNLISFTSEYTEVLHSRSLPLYNFIYLTLNTVVKPSLKIYCFEIAFEN